MKRNKKNKISVLIVIFLILLLLSLRAVFYLASESRKARFSEKSNLVIAVLGKENLLVDVNRFSQKTFIIKIPKNINQMIDERNPDYFKKSVSNFFAVPVNAFYKNSSATAENFDIKLKDVLAKKTDMTIFDYLVFKKTGYKTEIIDLAEVKHTTRFFKGESQLVFNYVDLDQKLSEFFQDEYLSDKTLLFQLVGKRSRHESLIFNERLISNLGFKLADVEIDDEKGINAKNICFVKKSLDTFLFLKNIFGCEIKLDSSISYDVVLRLAD